MSRFRGVIAVAAVLSLVLAAHASSDPSSSAQAAPTLLSPPAGATFAVGTRMAFQIQADAASNDGSLWLYVSRSPAVANACGTIAHDAEIEPFVRMSDPAVFEARPEYFSYSGFWMNTPGTYYWQAYQIYYQGGADGCLESEVRSFRIVGTAPSPTPKPKPTPIPKPALALAKARLQGNFEVVTRIRSATGVDVKPGQTDRGVWGFKPYSRSGPGDVRMTFRYRGASFDRHRLTLRLDRNGASYTGTGKAMFLECFMKDVPGPITVTVRVRKGAWIGGVWRAARIAGTYVHTTRSATSGIYRCPAAKVIAGFSGSLEK